MSYTSYMRCKKYADFIMNLIGKAMSLRFPIRLYYDRTPSRNIQTPPSSKGMSSMGAVSGVPASEATSGRELKAFEGRRLLSVEEAIAAGWEPSMFRTRSQQ